MEPEEVTTTLDYETGLSALRGIVEEIAKLSDGESLSNDKAEDLKKKVSITAMNARKLRREMMFGLERKRYSVTRNTEILFQEDTAVKLLEELTKAGKLCSQLTATEIRDNRDSANEALSVPLEQFLENNILPEGETETESEQLVRRIEYEIKICEQKADELQVLTQEKIKHSGALKLSKRFLQSSVAPLSDIATRIERTNSSIGGNPEAVSGITPSYLPVSLFRLYQYLEKYLAVGAVTLEGNVSDARAFTKAGKHTLQKCSLTELFPIRITANLPTGDSVLRLYFLPAKQGVIAEAIGFDQCLLSNLSPGAACISGLLYQGGTLVTGIATKWLENIASSPSYNPASMQIVDVLCKDIGYRIDLQRMLNILKSRTCLCTANLTNLVLQFLPSYPVPKVTVSDVKLESISREKDDKRGKKEDLSRKDDLLPKSVSIKLDMEGITYKITGLISTGYPNTAPQFKIRIRRDEDKQSKTTVPDSLKDLAAPIASLSNVTPAVPGVQLVVCKQKNKKTSTKKRTRAVAEDDYTGFNGELTEYYSRLINRDVVRDTPASEKGQLLIRQILMSLFCVQNFHPLLLIQGVARTWISCPSNPSDAMTTIHDPSSFKLHHHAKVFRGREVHLPMYWGNDQSLQWGYRHEQVLDEDSEKNNQLIH